MSQKIDQLTHDAELILSLYGNAQAAKRLLLNIEQQLSQEGVNIAALHQQVVSLNLPQNPDQYRCDYHLHDSSLAISTEWLPLSIR